MTDRFNKFIPFILEWETEYNKDGSVRTERDPDDPGGTTRYGIDQRSHPRVDINSLTLEQAKDIYFKEWTNANIEDMPTGLGEVYFNALVNAGEGRARKLSALSGGSPKRFIMEQGKFYRKLSEGRPVMRKFLRGWINRLNALWDFLKLGNPTTT